jgi:hypothetical protein
VIRWTSTSLLDTGSAYDRAADAASCSRHIRIEEDP